MPPIKKTMFMFKNYNFYAMFSLLIEKETVADFFLIMYEKQNLVTVLIKSRSEQTRYV